MNQCPFLNVTITWKNAVTYLDGMDYRLICGITSYIYYRKNPFNLGWGKGGVKGVKGWGRKIPHGVNVKWYKAIENNTE